MLLEHPNIDVNLQHENGCTALMFASYKSNTDSTKQIVQMLLNHSNIDVNIKNKDGNTALSLLDPRKHKKVHDLLLNHFIIQNAIEYYVKSNNIKKLIDLFPKLEKVHRIDFYIISTIVYTTKDNIYEFLSLVSDKYYLYHQLIIEYSNLISIECFDIMLSFCSSKLQLNEIDKICLLYKCIYKKPVFSTKINEETHEYIKKKYVSNLSKATLLQLLNKYCRYLPNLNLDDKTYVISKKARKQLPR